MAATRSAAAARTGTGTKTRHLRVTARAAVLLLIVFVLGAALVYPARLYIEQRAELADLQQRTNQLVAENEKLTNEVKQLNDPTYLEQLARECLGMVKPGETAFVVVPKGTTPKPPAC